MSAKSDQAVAYFKEGYNCAQAVVLAFADEAGIDRKTAAMLASSFGGGMGRLREVCGAVSGMFIVAGLKNGYASPDNKEAKKAHYEKIQELAEQFRKENGAIVCRELLALNEKTSDPAPDERTDAYYKKRPCVQLVECAVKIMEHEINNHNYGEKMITGYYCTNIFSEQAKDQIAFYRQILEIPFIKTDDDDSNGVYLGFIENAPTLCIWDCKKYNAQPTGRQSFVFQTENLDSTIECLKKKGLALPEPVRYDWGTYEVRLSDLDGNEIVIAEFK